LPRVSIFTGGKGTLYLNKAKKRGSRDDFIGQLIVEGTRCQVRAEVSPMALKSICGCNANEPKLYIMDEPNPFKPLLPRPRQLAAYLRCRPIRRSAPWKNPRPQSTASLIAAAASLFGGGSKTFKAWMQCDLAICLAEASSVGFACHRCNVLYVNLELKDYYIRSRLKKSAAHAGSQSPTKSQSLEPAQF
jgi:hypothetical protein